MADGGYLTPTINTMPFSVCCGVNVSKISMFKYIWNQARHDGICVTHRPIRKGDRYELHIEGAGRVIVGLTGNPLLAEDIRDGNLIQKSVGNWFEVRLKNETEKLTVECLHKEKIAIYQSNSLKTSATDISVLPKDKHYLCVNVLFGELVVELINLVTEKRKSKKKEEILTWHPECGKNVCIRPTGTSLNLRFSNPLGICAGDRHLKQNEPVFITIMEALGKWHYLQLALSNKMPEELRLDNIDRFYSGDSAWPPAVQPFLKLKAPSEGSKIRIMWIGETNILYAVDDDMEIVLPIYGVKHTERMYLYLEPFRQQIMIESQEKMLNDTEYSTVSITSNFPNGQSDYTPLEMVEDSDYIVPIHDSTSPAHPTSPTSLITTSPTSLITTSLAHPTSPANLITTSSSAHPTSPTSLITTSPASLIATSPAHPTSPTSLITTRPARLITTSPASLITTRPASLITTRPASLITTTSSAHPIPCSVLGAVNDSIDSNQLFGSASGSSHDAVDGRGDPIENEEPETLPSSVTHVTMPEPRPVNNELSGETLPVFSPGKMAENIPIQHNDEQHGLPLDTAEPSANKASLQHPRATPPTSLQLPMLSQSHDTVPPPLPNNLDIMRNNAQSVNVEFDVRPKIRTENAQSLQTAQKKKSPTQNKQVQGSIQKAIQKLFDKQEQEQKQSNTEPKTSCIEQEKTEVSKKTSLRNEPSKRSVNQSNWQKRLQKSFTFLLTNLEPVRLADKLYEKMLITDLEHEKITLASDTNREKKCRILIDKIQRMSHSEEEIIESLKETDQQHIAEQLSQM